MSYLLSAFKAISIVFAISAVVTGAGAIVNPVWFSNSFGLPLDTRMLDPSGNPNEHENAVTSSAAAILHSRRSLTKSYISLMGVRQLATGIILLTFAFQDKWTEVATILAIIGIVVAGTDGVYLSRAGGRRLGQLHAIPGAAIALLACGVLYSEY
ncbi:putative DUF4267 domain-containing protein [Seiridium cardinale]